MRARRWSVLLCLFVASCASTTPERPPTAHPSSTTTENVVWAPSPPGTAATRSVPVPPVRIVLVGDVMLGRGVGPVVAADPSSVFERLRPVLAGADLALGNLESPLTDRPHVVGEYALEADPASASLLAGAGFDVLAIANNHATDAGPATVSDTIAALAANGLMSVGGGMSAPDAAEPLIVDLGGITVGVVAFDSAGGQAATASEPGVNPWDVETANATVTELRGVVDVVVVGLHSGVEYLTRPDPALVHMTELLAEWGADVVWGHGAHVEYPVETTNHGERTAVVAPGLGNALFDQRMPRTRAGAVLEVLADADGIVAMRTGRLSIEAGRSTFDGWDDPVGDAAALDADWWTPVRAWSPVVRSQPAWGASPLPHHADEEARSIGDVTGTGVIDIVLASRRPASSEPAHDALPDVDWVDAEGRTAHLGVYTAEGRLRWGSALMFRPVDTIVVCDGSMALGFTTMSDPTIAGAGAWFWDGFGFRTAPFLPGPATPTCADIDGDGRGDPVLTGRERIDEND